ncbi:protein of unknown function [Candidatus Nitrosocosmicus franklandus]|uniref:Uncharacterized protein n=1 Tax=Candidatus Nitrosocosmicus franklandianus TaxID=1798806 RepID=A0A484IHS0_9ARCH|nr:protein of unknown function [Candidatus Nitrosocosmicus franklandus]
MMTLRNLVPGHRASAQQDGSYQAPNNLNIYLYSILQLII